MERLIEITREEYVTLGDAGVWVYGHWLKERPPEQWVASDNHDTALWESEKLHARDETYTVFYTKVSDDV